MKSLNRTLSLVLVLVMVLGLIGVAGAADFKDSADIKNDEAVNTMAALNIINGKNGNVFDPTGTVTRAEMAKMICVALNGGKEPTLGTTSATTYTDTKGHWAAGYIEYCTNLGIVAGMGDGTFAPDATVTGSQAAKMMLVAMNYNATVFGFTGANWEATVNVQANKAGLYKDLSIDASAALSRDNAAQLIYNGIRAGTMQRDWTLDPTTGKTTETYKLGAAFGEAADSSIAFEKFGLKTAYGVVGTTTYNSTDKKYTTNLTAITGKTAVPGGQIVGTVDYSAFYGQQIKVLYKDTDDVYGVYAYKSNVVLSGVLGQLADSDIADAIAGGKKEIKYNGTTYKFGDTLDNIEVYDFNAAASTASLQAYFATTTTTRPFFASYIFKAIDVDGDGKIDSVVVYPTFVAKVNYVDSESATLTPAALYAQLSYTTDAALSAAKFEDVNCYAGIAKGDWVKVTLAANTADGTDTYEKIAPMTGEVTKTTFSTLPKAMINGMYFADIISAAGIVGKTGTMTLGSTYENIIQVNTFVFNAEQTASATSKGNYALVIAKAEEVTMQGDQAKLLFADGTKKVVNLKSGQTLGTFTEGKAVTYTVNSSDEYTLALATGTVGGFVNDTISDGALAFANDELTIGTYSIADDAVVFYKKGTDYDVMTGKQLKTYSNNATTGVASADTAFYTTNSSTGYSTIKLAYVTLGASATSSDAKYGYALGTLGKYTEDGTTLYTLTYWNGTEEVKDAVVASVEDNVGSADFTVASIDKGTFFKYTLNSKGQMVIDQVDADAHYVEAVDGKNVKINGAVGAKTDDNTVFFYINSAEKTYAKGGEIQLAKGTQNNVFCINADSATGAFKLIVVDVKNNMITTALHLG